MCDGGSLDLKATGVTLAPKQSTIPCLRPQVAVPNSRRQESDVIHSVCLQGDISDAAVQKEWKYLRNHFRVEIVRIPQFRTGDAS